MPSEKLHERTYTQARLHRCLCRLLPKPICVLFGEQAGAAEGRLARDVMHAEWIFVKRTTLMTMQQMDEHMQRTYQVDLINE